MPLVFADRVKETSTSVGLSSLALDGAVDGFRTFAEGIGNGNQCYYVIENESDNTWEVGIGTVAGATLSRDSVLSSSDVNLPINFAAGTKQVFATEAAEHFLNTLDTASHALEDHTGLPGIPDAETFTAAVHTGTNHTGLPGIPAAEVFTSAAHDLVDHTLPPFDLLDAAAHALIDHTGIPGVGGGGGGETFTKAVHDADPHADVTAIQPPSQVEAELGTATVSRFWTAQRVAQAIAAQAMRVATMTFSGVNTITVATGFQPAVALFVGKYDGLTQVNTIGYAVGTLAGEQGCSIAGAGGSASGSVAADSGGGVTPTQAHAVTTFNNASVEATQGTGTNTWSGFVVVLGTQF